MKFISLSGVSPSMKGRQMYSLALNRINSDPVFLFCLLYVAICVSGVIWGIGIDENVQGRWYV